MSPAAASLSERTRRAVLLEHVATIDDPRDARRITHPQATTLARAPNDRSEQDRVARTCGLGRQQVPVAAPRMDLA